MMVRMGKTEVSEVREGVEAQPPRYSVEELAVLVELAGEDNIENIRLWLRNTRLEQVEELVTVFRGLSTLFRIRLARSTTPSDSGWLDVLAYASADRTTEDVLLSSPHVSEQAKTYIRAEGVEARRDTIKSFTSSDSSALAALLTRMADDHAPEVRELVGGNPKTPQAVLDRLADDPNGYVRWEVAHNFCSPTKALQRLAYDPVKEVRSGIAMNPHTPTSALAVLAGDIVRAVREAVAGNIRAPQGILLQLAGDRHWRVRFSLAGNTAVPETLLLVLATDRHADVRQAALENPSFPQKNTHLRQC